MIGILYVLAAVGAVTLLGLGALFLLAWIGTKTSPERSELHRWGVE